MSGGGGGGGHVMHNLSCSVMSCPFALRAFLGVDFSSRHGIQRDRAIPEFARDGIGRGTLSTVRCRVGLSHHGIGTVWTGVRYHGIDQDGVVRASQSTELHETGYNGP